ncbi:MAG TPA: decaprenyl-phosphate phosphoribosyltransferase [Kouleothrix sp.]|mgnify:CR=1 FL=1|uniref:decaprenyl-phosphate phosphoribosyltransferase n=1 Tax=Kouleothrix sp. TaxID=2779161 RepID=UPI002C6EAC2C|nr:decaprenyl-phosphate phosphoribosyltransferase [Kouleothrix sp.]
MAHSLELKETRARGAAVLAELLRAMRPKEWIKNIFVFAAIAFARDSANGTPLWQELDKLLIVAVAFVLFCMAASAIYLINDLVDIEKDRAHPKKKSRPLASGRLSPALARVAAVLLLLLALPGAFLLDYMPGQGLLRDIDFGVALLSYVLIQGVLYSYYLKNIVILDIFTIAAGFVLRAVAGALVLDIQITYWLLMCMGLLALFLGLAKRRAELILLEHGAGEHRRILAEYSLPMLDQMISIITAATIIAYTLFTTTAETLPRHPFPIMLITVPVVIYLIFRYLYLMYKHGEGGSPADLIIKDVPFIAAGALWGALVLAILALAH